MSLYFFIVYPRQFKLASQKGELGLLRYVSYILKAAQSTHG